MKSKGEKANSDKYTITDARRLWMVWWNRNTPDLLNLRAKHHAEGQRAFQHLLAEARADLRTDEAVERVALVLIEQRGYYIGEGWPTNEDLSGGPAGDRDVEFKSAWMDSAREIITALLGEEE